MERECGTREDSIRESSIMHALAAAVFSPKVDDWKMSRVLRHDGLMVLFVRRTPFRADRRDSRDVQECGMCDLQCGTGISGKGCGTL